MSNSTEILTDLISCVTKDTGSGVTFGGLLLIAIISELLPFTAKTKHNGVVHTLVCLFRVATGQKANCTHAEVSQEEGEEDEKNEEVAG